MFRLSIRLFITVAMTFALLVSCSTLQHSKNPEEGWASWYGKQFQGHRTASGERYDMHKLTAAHRTLPFGTRVLVKSRRSGKTVKVRINDRGPYAQGRIIDLSYAAAAQLGILQKGEDEVILQPE